MKKIIATLIILPLIMFNYSIEIMSNENSSIVNAAPNCDDSEIFFENSKTLETHEEKINRMDMALMDALNKFDLCNKDMGKASSGGSAGGSSGGSSGGSAGGSAGGYKSDGSEGISSSMPANEVYGSIKKNDPLKEDINKTKDLKSLTTTDKEDQRRQIKTQDDNFLKKQIKEMCDGMKGENKVNCLKEYNKY